MCSDESFGKGVVLDIPYPSHQSPKVCVILSEAPAKFVSGQNHWRGVEGSRGSIPGHAASGSSPKDVIPARCGLSGLFLGDRSPTLSPLGAFHSSHGTGKCKPQAFTGTGYGENSLRQYGEGQCLGILRLRAHHFREAASHLGASLRMTQGKGAFELCSETNNKETHRAHSEFFRKLLSRALTRVVFGRLFQQPLKSCPDTCLPPLHILPPAMVCP